MICPRCGQPNSGSAGRCDGCGTALAGGGAPAAGAVDRTLTGAGVPATAAGPLGFAPLARLAPGTLLGTRYEILSVLGEGGMGTVYKAQDRELGRLVALKVIRPEMAARPEILERFKREILLASQVTHKNVLRIHDFGEAGEVRFISMHYVEGMDLKTLLEKEGPLSLDRGLPLARQIGEALQAAHDAGIVHRDLKPQNILLDRDGNAYIADFGISRSLAEGGTMTDTGAILGTVDYMSPEQARGETPDHRGDLFSFGVILYEMFTGTLPFRASNALSIMMKRLHEDAPPMRQARPDLPAWLQAIVARALQRRPEDRYPTAGEMLRDLEQQRASRSWRRFARPRYAVPAAAAVLAAVLGVLLARGMIPFRPSASPAATARTSLVVLPFRNATGDPGYDWVRTGVPSLVHSELIDLKTLRLVGQERAEEILEALKVPSDADPPAATLRRVTSLLGAEHVLSGRLVKIADRLRLDATLQSGPETAPAGAAGGGPQGGASIVVEGRGDQAIFAMVDDLTLRVRNHLGLSRGFLEKRRTATELTTRSVEALGLYSEGLALARAGQHLDAAKRLEGALEKDAQFSVARALLAEIYDRLGYSDKAVAEANRAAAGIGSASPYEATRIRAVQARVVNDSAKALEAYRRLSEIAPNSAETIFDLAAAQEDAGDLEEALRSLRKVITLDPKHPTAHYALGRVHFKLGHHADALQEFTTALSLHAESGDDEGRATVLNGLGNAYRGMGKRDEALAYYRDSLEIRRRIGDRRGVAAVLGNLALLQQEMGRNQEAIASATEAVDISRDIGDRNGLAFAYAELGDIYQDAGRPEDALGVYQESLKIVRETDDQVNLARSLSNVGYINVVLGRYVEAYFFLKEALEKRRQIGDTEEIVRSLIDLGFLEQVQGRYEEALKYETEGLSMARASSNTGATLVLLINLANVHEDQGEYGSALSQLGDAESMAREMNDTRLIATCLIYLGSARRHAGDLAGAEAALDQGLRLAREMNNVPLVAEALTFRAALHLTRGQRDRALAVSREAVTAATQARDVRLSLLARLQAAEAARSVRGLEAVLKEAQSDALKPIVAQARLALARLHFEVNRLRETLQEAQQAIAAASPLVLRDVLFQACHLAGKSLKRQGLTSKAAEQFSAGLEPLEEMRRSLQGETLSHFLGRPATAGFGRDALETLREAGLAREAGRLALLLRP